MNFDPRGASGYKRNAQREPLPPKCIEVKHPITAETQGADGEYLTGNALRCALIGAGVLVPKYRRELDAGRGYLFQDDVGRVEAANGIFYNEDRRIVAMVAAGGDTRGVLTDPVVLETLQALRADPVAVDAREGMFAPGGGKVRYERWPHPAPEEPDESTVFHHETRTDFAPCGNRPSPDRDALDLVMSPRQVRTIPGTDDEGRWVGGGRIARPYVRDTKPVEVTTVFGRGAK